MRKYLSLWLVLVLIAPLGFAGGSIEVVEWDWWQTNLPDWVQMGGEIKNVSNHELKGVQYIIVYYDESGSMIGREKHYVDQYDLSPGNTSTFGTKTVVSGKAHRAKITFVHR